MRLRKKPWVLPALGRSPYVIQDPVPYRGRWFSFFGKEGPLHIEIGTGKGKFITTMARLHPENLYLGVEMKPEAMIYALRRIEENPPHNIGLLLFHAERLEEAFSEGEVDRIYLNFTDPWPKRRHAKRRLTHPRYLEAYRRLLKPGGEIHLKTDHPSLFEFSLNTLSDEGFRLRNITFDLHHSAFAEGNVTTEYEEKYMAQGISVYRLEAIYNAT